MAGRQYALILIFALATQRLALGQSSLAPQAGILALKNGQVMEGEIIRAGDYYVVSRGENSEIRLKADDVELFCSSLIEAYDLKVRHLSGFSAKSNLDLAKWCLRHGLFAQCSEQLVAARRLDPTNSQVAELETRLQLALESPPSPNPASKSPPVAPDDVEAALQSLPRASIEKFGAVVQPILLNRCGANQCHGPNAKSDFRLLRPPQGQIVSRRFTQRNLYAALRFVDRENPDHSPLVALPQQRHGSSLSAVFDKHSVGQLAELLTWARLTSGGAATPPPRLPTTIAPVEATLSQPAARSNVDSTPPADEAPAPGAPNESAANRPSPAAPTKVAGQPAFRDRFDPEIFNRHFHGK
jgi:hypothetical protein